MELVEENALLETASGPPVESWCSNGDHTPKYWWYAPPLTETTAGFLHNNHSLRCCFASATHVDNCSAMVASLWQRSLE
jgi:hypothetical protein